MFDRLRNGAFAGGGALLLVLALSGMAMGASLTSDSAPATDTSFVDIDGDGVADHCQTEAAAENAEAALAAFEAADLNDDGEISVSEAAQTGWTGGVNCNHGGYVSEVAQADEEACETETTEPEGTEETTEGTEETTEGTEETTEGTEEEAAPEEETADCEAAEEETEETEEAAADETCEAVPAPELDPETDTSTWNHGAWVTWVAKSDATGGKNCNHGGAVSEASKAANEAAKAEREAAKAERDAARDARKAEQKAERDARKAERQAAKAAKGHGKPN